MLTLFFIIILLTVVVLGDVLYNEACHHHY